MARLSRLINQRELQPGLKMEEAYRDFVGGLTVESESVPANGGIIVAGIGELLHGGANGGGRAKQEKSRFPS